MDLANQQNWNIVYRNAIAAQKLSDGSYLQLNDLTVGVKSPVLMIGLINRTARHSWYRGAYASMRLPILPGSNTEFLPVVDAANKICRVNALTLIQFPFLKIPHYYLVLSFPKWFDAMYIEVWSYSESLDGSYNP